MVNLPQNPLLFGDSLWLYDHDKETPIYTANKRKRNPVKNYQKHFIII